MLGSLLHYSNIVLQETIKDNLEVTTVKMSKDVENASRLLGVLTDDLVAQLTYRTIQLRGETVSTPLKLANAKDVHDAFIKGVYGRLFTWIVDKTRLTLRDTTRDRQLLKTLLVSTDSLALSTVSDRHK